MKRKEQRKQNKNTSIRSKQLEARGVSMDMETSWAAQEMTSTFSDLNHMARFQQKQLQEKEQKLLQLYDQQQQRAYQVVQRGSAGSNGSNHGSSINQHTVTKTTTTSHTTSTSHGGKVRQMFDERRQTTVKGIDRSYPLEPLENKPRKQTNGNVAQKNGNLTVNRQSVTVKRVARADVNSNLNGGKPIVSYHEEITRESYPAGRQQSDDDEFGNENHINQYANGNQTHVEEALNEDTIERNRMMAKLHLMEYDDTLKHRVKNDLESEEFPADYMVDVPDKLPKRSVTKKLSQAEARLERFKNVNAKRSITKNPGTVLKKRSDPILPAKSTSSEDRDKTRTRQIFDRGLSRRGSRDVRSNVKFVSLENVDERSLSSSDKNLKKDEDNRVYYKEGEMLMSSEIDKELKTRGRSESPKLFCEESEQSAKSAMDGKYREKLSHGFSKNLQRSESPSYFDSKTTRKSTDQFLFKDRTNRSESPKFFCKESEKSATTYALDSRTREKLSPESSGNIKKRSASPNTVEKYPQFSKDVRKRSESPKFFCKESEKSATTYALDSRTREKLSPEFSRDIKQSKSPNTVDKLASLFSKNIRKRSECPKYFCEESEKSATTYAIDSKTSDKLSPGFSKDVIKHGKSNKSFDSEASEMSTYELLKNKIKRSESPKYFCKETEKSATTYAIDSRSRSTSPDFIKTEAVHRENMSPRNYPKIETHEDEKSASKMPNVFERLTRERSTSPKFLQTITTRIKNTKSPHFTKRVPQKHKSPENTKSKSPNSVKKLDGRSSTSPQFFGSDSERSAPIMLVTPETILKKKPESKKRYSKSTVIGPKRTMSEEIVDASSKQNIRSSVSRFFTEQCEKASRKLEADEENNVQSAVTDKNRRWSRDSSPLSLKDMRASSPQFSGKPISATSIDSVRDWSPKSKRNSPEPGNRIRPKSTENTSIRSKQVFAKKSRSPDNLKAANKMADRVLGNVLRSTSLIRDAINQSNKPYEDVVDKCGAKGYSRTCRVDKNTVGTSVAIDSKLEVEDGKDERKVDERSRTPSSRMFEFSATESSPKSSTSVEVDAEIQEITMSDQYIEHQPREVRSKSRDKTPDCVRSSTEKLFTYSVRKPARKKASLFESNVFELSKKDQGKTDRREISGRKERVSPEYTLKNTRSPSADSLTFRDSKCSAEKNGETNTKTTMEDLRVHKGEYDHFKDTKRDWSSSSPNDLTFRGSKSPIEESEEIRKVEMGGSRSEIKFESRKRKGDNVRRTQRNWADSPPTSDLTFRGYKHPLKKNEVNRKTEVGSCISTEKKVLRDYQREKYDNFKRKGRNWSNTSPTNNMTFRVFKCPSEENEKGRKIKTGVSRSPEGIVFDEYNKEKRDHFQHAEQHLSSSPSSTNSSFRDSKPELNESTKMNKEIKVEVLQKRKSLSDKREGNVNFERRQRSWSSNPSPTSNLTVRSSKCVTKNVTKKDKATFQSRERKTVNQSKKIERTKQTIRSKSSDPITSTSKRRVSESSVNQRHEIRGKAANSKSPETSKVTDSEILRSMELVRRVMKGGALKQEETIKTAISDETVGNKETEVKKSDSARTMKIETRKSSSTIVYLNDESSSSKNYERTDSVESALRRFDSIGTESVQSITEKRQTVEESRNDSKSISLKALDQIDGNLPQSLTNEPSLKRTSVSGKTTKNESEARHQRKSAKPRDSIEVVRIAMGSKSPTCKRKLFPDDETSSGNSKPKSGSKISEKVLGKSHSKVASRCLDEEAFIGDKLKNETRGASTGVSLSVKHLRSIEDIRKSIDSLETEGTSTKSVIANETLKRSDATRSKRLASRRTDVDGNKKETISPGRSENFTAKKGALGDQERSSIKCAMRFSRVTKSPSPDSTKTTESSSRARRNVLTSPSKSPDTVTMARRPSTELKAQEARSMKRPTLMKGTEPIGNRKTATSTSTRKSTDVVDGAILENGVHLRDQTAETKYDNDSSATKKSDAFVIDFDEQPPKENDAPVPRKSLLRKHSTDRQIPSTQAGRPPSSVSSISSGSSMPIQVSGSRGKMASKPKTPSATAQRGSASSKSGGCAVVADSLVPCKMCGRRFAQDRVGLHEQICTKTTQKKRKQFDAMMYRVKGTDLEPFVKKGLCKKQPEKSKKPEPKSNWRRKHEDFINAIRSAKQVQAHLAAGGKLSDLPPPPVSDTSDYIQCPHCGRKFNQSAAERHIPKCEHMLHNKPVHSRAPKPKR